MYSEEKYNSILAVCRSYKNDYDRAFERLKSQQQEIDVLRKENEILKNQVENKGKETAEKILKDVQKKITQLRLNGHLSREQDIRLSRFLVGKAQDYGIEVETKE